MRVAHFQLQRALHTVEALTGHVVALDHTLDELSHQIESARQDTRLLRAHLDELRGEMVAAVQRVEQILAQRAEYDDTP